MKGKYFVPVEELWERYEGRKERVPKKKIFKRKREKEKKTRSHLCLRVESKVT